MTYNLGTLNLMLAKAIREQDHKRIGNVVDILRHNGMRYAEIAQLACAAAGIDANEWETILYDVDSQHE